MRRLLLTSLGLLVAGTAFLAAPKNVTAGEYYEGGYVTRGVVSYSSSCCYRKVVRYVRTVRYVRVRDRVYGGTYAPPYRNSYYGTPYRTVYYGEPYRGPHYYEQPYRYVGAEYDGYSTARVGYRVRYGENCTVRRVRVADGYGGWVWATSRLCY
ncbi:MAG: hypothetical protein JSR61_11770 [Proteobacteria bacterium]|nr:hypothetical protein [Pseudomonadota bacterium]